MKDGHVMECVKDQYRHGKTILAIGASKVLLDRVEVTPELANVKADTGVVITADASMSVDVFIKGVAMHRHPERETDPPLV